MFGQSKLSKRNCQASFIFIIKITSSALVFVGALAKIAYVFGYVVPRPSKFALFHMLSIINLFAISLAVSFIKFSLSIQYGRFIIDFFWITVNFIYYHIPLAVLQI